MIEFLMSYGIPVFGTFLYMVAGNGVGKMFRSYSGMKGDINTIVIIFWPIVVLVMGLIWVEES